MSAATLPRATLPSTPETIAAALIDLLQSDGWALVEQMVDQQFGPTAFENAVVAAMTELTPGDMDGQRETVGQINAAFKAARAVLQLPHDKLRQAQNVPKDAGGSSIAERMRVFRERVSW